MLPDDMRRDAHDQACHTAFLRRAFALPLAGALAAPVLVALQGALPLWQVAVLCACILPLTAILLTQRGAFDAARVAQVASLAALAVNLSLGLGFSVAVVGVLLAACCEAASLDKRRIPTLLMIVVATLVCFVLPHGATNPILTNMGILVFATAYCTALVLQWRAESARQSQEQARSYSGHAALEEVLADTRLHFSRSGAVIFVDPACRNKLNLMRRDLLGRGFLERVALADHPVLIKALGDAADTSCVQVVYLDVHLRDQESPRGRFITPIYARMEIRLRALAEDEILALLRDVTPPAATQNLVSIKDECAWKDRLIANVSHELRTPLNAIIGFSEMLAGEQEPANVDTRREYAGIIHASGQHLLGVVNSILDMSQIEAGAFPMETEFFSFAILVDECCDMMRLKADEEGLALRRQLQRDARDMVADRRACKQVLINLLSNAIKFTPRGGSVTVHAQQAGQDLLIAVSDTGVGIAPEHLPRLGDPFFQAQSNYNRAYEGTGLGLSVVKGLVGLHGGSLSIESAPGQGTCVTVRLPLDCRPFKAGEAKPADIHSTPRVAAGSLPDMTMVKKIA